MQGKQRTTLLGLLLAGLLLASTQTALASTQAGTTISNQAEIRYKVGGIDQGPIPSEDPDNPGNPTEFQVDLLLKPQVTRNSAATVNVTPSQSDALHTFRVDNLGNDTAGGDQYFELTIATPTDDLGVTAVTVDIDLNNDGTFDLLDQAISAAAGPVVQINTESYITVRLEADIPAGIVNNDTSVYDLIATATDSGGTALAAAGAPTDGVDNVFGDGAGTAGGDGATNGQHSARGTYLGQTAAFSISKTDSVAGGYYIPGAVVTYDITLDNNGAEDATAVEVTDPIPANTTYEEFTTCGGAKEWYLTSTSAWTSIDPGNSSTDVDKVRCTIASIAAGGDPVTVTFKVTIE